MPIWLHLTLYVVTQFASLILGIGLGMVLFEALPFDWDTTNDAIAFFAGLGAIAISFTLLSTLCTYLLKHIIPGRCPSCGGRAIFHNSYTRKVKTIFGTARKKYPIMYHCQACGKVTDTKVYEGKNSKLR